MKLHFINYARLFAQTEAMEEKSIFELTRPFLDSLGMQEFTFFQENIENISYAAGYKQNGEEVAGTRLMFPAFAAGAMGTSASCIKFLQHLAEAFQNKDGQGIISHDTAVELLYGRYLCCKKFMGCLMGLGVFIAEVGDNKFAIHQGANDGFRGI